MFSNHVRPVVNDRCIFFRTKDSRCKASSQNEPVGERRQRLYCLSDDHDGCPFYLAYMLRHSYPKSRYSSHEEFKGK
jgi:hypothetical protein